MGSGNPALPLNSRNVPLNPSLVHIVQLHPGFSQRFLALNHSHACRTQINPSSHFPHEFLERKAADERLNVSRPVISFLFLPFFSLPLRK